MFVDDWIEGIWVYLWLIVKRFSMIELIVWDNESTSDSMVEHWSSKTRGCGFIVLCTLKKKWSERVTSIPIIIHFYRNSVSFPVEFLST